MKFASLKAVCAVIAVILPAAGMAHMSQGQAAWMAANAASIAPAAVGAEATLRAVINEAYAGTVDYTRLESDIVASVKENQAGVINMLQRFGEIKAVTYRGQSKGPAKLHKFEVQHANGRSKWRISLAPDGKISNLLFQPA
jgi:hypothetical protein